MTRLPTSLQTSPYLTRVDPGAPPPVRYFSDTSGPTDPHSDPPGEGAVFGIVGLERRVDWHTDARMLDLLIACARRPRDRAELAHRFGATLVDEAVTRTIEVHVPDAERHEAAEAVRSLLRQEARNEEDPEDRLIFQIPDRTQLSLFQ